MVDEGGFGMTAFGIIGGAILAGLTLTGLGGYLLWRLRRLSRSLLIDRGRTSAILQAAVDGVVTIDGTGRIESFNPAAERLFGYSAAEVVGRDVSMLMPEPHRSRHHAYLNAYLDTGEAKVIGIGREVEGLRKDGSTFAMELSLGESVQGGRRLFAGIIRDITDRKRHEAALRDSEAKARAVLETAVDGIITIDRHGLITSANPAAERLFGHPVAEMVGRPVTMLMPESYRAGHQGHIDRHIATGERKIIGIGREVEGLRRDGTVFPMELAVGEAMVAGERVYTGIVRDITDRKRGEAALRDAKEAAERAQLAQSKFLAAASHDLRQPVQAMTLFASALSDKINGAPASALLDDMRGSLDALTMLLDALLDVSRLDSGTVVPHETTFSLATVLERLATEFGPQMEQKEIELRVIPSSAVVRSDPMLIYRILQNFLSNSLRYTSQGRVVLGCRRRGRKLRIEVVDSGIGIDPRHHERIFTEFFQVGNPERDRTKGLGLGLAIVARLSHLLNCPITMRSLSGHGSAFGVDVPLVSFNRRENVVPFRPAPAEPMAPGRGFVFIIDDEPTVLRSLRAVIEGWGFTVMTARTELETITQLTGRATGPDLVIADYRLRGICNGAQVIRQIRDMFDHPIAGFIITGDTSPEQLREVVGHGIKVLHKPVGPAELREAIDIGIASAEKAGTPAAGAD